MKKHTPSTDNTARLTAAAVRRFIEGNTVLALDPDTGEQMARVTYRRDGSCHFEQETGETDTGCFGFIGDRYWTQYENFRGGERNEFYLVAAGEGRAQAWFADGRRAFLQVVERAAG